LDSCIEDFRYDYVIFNLTNREFVGLQAIHTMKVTESPIAVFVVFVGEVGNICLAKVRKKEKNNKQYNIFRKSFVSLQRIKLMSDG